MPKKIKKSVSEENPQIIASPPAAEVNEPPVAKEPWLSLAAKNLKRSGIFIVAGVIVLGSLFYASQLRRQNRLAQEELNKFKSGSQDFAKQEASELLGQLGKLIILPANEQPTIATVSDIEKLKDQPFFQNGRVGDKVVIYSQAGKAILYRPEENKIVEVAPFTAPAASGGQVAGATSGGTK
jgi:hypothetical protein